MHSQRRDWEMEAHPSIISTERTLVITGRASTSSITSDYLDEAPIESSAENGLGRRKMTQVLRSALWECGELSRQL